MDALEALGGSGTPGDVIDHVAKSQRVPASELDRVDKNGGSRFTNQVHWARFYLSRGGLLDPSRRGVWTLTPEGRQTSLGHQEAVALHKRLRRFGHSRDILEAGDDSAGMGAPAVEEQTAAPPAGESYINEAACRAELGRLVCGSSAEGFKRFCQCLLRAIGFEEVRVTGKSGDGGIDDPRRLAAPPRASGRALGQLAWRAPTFQAMTRLQKVDHLRSTLTDRSDARPRIGSSRR